MKLLSVIVIAALFGGCSQPTGPRTVTNSDLAVKIPAMKNAAKEKDAAAPAQLVKDLGSDDAAVRFFAIGALRRLTGDDLGYRYYDDRPVRQPAVERWKQWLSEHAKQ